MRCGNLSKTAAEMQLSNVSVHKALHSLESALRCPLFKNEGRNLIPLKVLMSLKNGRKKSYKTFLLP
jgi:LysR family malonate utilization transcriptional regulator